jgi:tRNA threonylcarbamoyladenosine biosynthesis protein TsaB
MNGGLASGVRRSAGEDLLTLSADTATDTRSVAVMRGARLIALRVSDLRGTGAANALGEIDRTLTEASVELGEIDLFAVATGPGSFTGLRSGLATMKGLATVLNKPVVGVPTLHAVALAAGPSSRVAALIPAGRGEVFAQVLNVTREGEIEEYEKPAHVQPARFVESVVRMGVGVKWAGSGAQKFLETIREKARASGRRLVEACEAAEESTEDVWVLAPQSESLAFEIGLLAQAKFEKGARGSADELRALYVRPSDAEINEQCRAQV